MNVSFTRQAFFSFAAVLVMLAMVATPTVAQGAGDAGKNLLDTLQQMITGQLGLFIGLAVVILGLWTWIIKQETGAGITMILGGVLITLAPGLFNGMRKFAGGAIEAFAGGNASTVDTSY